MDLHPHWLPLRWTNGVVILQLELDTRLFLLHH